MDRKSRLASKMKPLVEVQSCADSVPVLPHIGNIAVLQVREKRNVLCKRLCHGGSLEAGDAYRIQMVAERDGDE